MGELHLEIYIERMKREYGVAGTSAGRVPRNGYGASGVCVQVQEAERWRGAVRACDRTTSSRDGESGTDTAS